MASKIYSSEAIVLSLKNYSEADKFVSLFSRTQGKMKLIAKGTRKPSSRKRGHLEVFNLIRFTGVKANLNIITEVQVIENFNGIKIDLKKISVAYFLLEVVSRLTNDEESNEQVYELLFETLKKVEESNNLKSIRYEYIKKILILLGFWPNGKEMPNPDYVLESVAERQFLSS